MNEVRTFKAATMQQALNLVRQELGAEAVILHTRQVAQRRFLPWKKLDEQVEITAGLGVNIRHPAGRLRLQRRSAASARTAETRPVKSQPINPQPAPVKPLPAKRPSPAVTPVTMALSELAKSTNPGAIDQTSAAATAQLAGKLDEIQKMLEQLGRSTHVRGAGEIPSELFNLYTELIDAEVEDDLARDLIFRLKQNATPGQLSDPAASRALLTAMVEAEIRCSDPIGTVPGKQKVVALVGATGVGKTTTIAKLAANFRLRDGVKMGLVTVDTYRIAAVEQLRTYAEIIDLPMKVVTNPLEMRRAFDELVGLDLVLIDTAGRSPRDELQIRELKRLLAEAHVDEVHLVLSMTASLRSLLATAEKFAAANTTSLILTKLDEAAGMGTLLSILRKIPLPISYLTTGQDVPDDIEPASATQIARLILGQSSIQLGM